MGLLLEKVVLVTGASAGIGLATAKHLHDEGAKVVATTHSEAGLKVLTDLVDSDRWEVRILDVTNERQVEEAVEFTVRRFGRLDGIVNNAGVLLPNDTASATVDEYDRTFDVNVKGVFLGSKYAIPALVAAGGGAIVNIGSINSLAAEKQLALYTASKGAVLMLTKAIALDHGGEGIRANAVCPGFVDTKLNVPHYNRLGGREALDAALPEWQPIGRAIEPVEIAQSVAFLLSDHARAITGTAFVVDGGVLSKA
ncbi:SDR family oxidoreductase [Streptomyces sp. VNUA24]|uniref:SDR family NAD(P)-dependent oxidoreductase n=1 Tax=Streptomyces sp. VNUA24 TaxID=3031131 RepID=UPI0023B7A443|nr:SDR family oxidoreductase [Streptomyces sp. VNUA24]WEH13189.1 SDR family oxidoreductase [Streptomyces sp. VNUA24]